MANSLTRSRVVGEDSPLKSCGRAIKTAPGEPDPNSFIANCFLNCDTTTSLVAASSVTLGTQDFAAEFWGMPFGVGPNTFHQPIGLRRQGVAQQGFQIDHVDAGAGPLVQTNFRRLVAGPITGALVAMTPGWHHYVANYDRDGLATLLIDGVSSDTVDISAGAADVLADSTHEAMSASGDAACVGVGPMAYHVNTLLTAAQIADSLARKYVQNLSQTVALWDPRFIYGHTGWTSETTAFAGSYMYSQGENADQPVPIPYATPFGAFGTVTIPDLSGSSNPLTVRTFATYPTAAVTFGYDPFWLK